jgi:hypothetical protein
MLAGTVLFQSVHPSALRGVLKTKHNEWSPHKEIQLSALFKVPVVRKNLVRGDSFCFVNDFPDRAILFHNPAAFAAPAPGTYGNLSRNSLKGHGVFQLDLALSRTFDT